MKISSPDDVTGAAEVLQKGGLVIYPTETSYGIGCDATNSEAIKNVYRLKGRDYAKPLSIIVADVEMAKKYIGINKTAETLVKKFMPGPLTLVAKKRNLPDELCRETIAFRISSNKFATGMTKKLGNPITATSANISGDEPIYEIKKIKLQFKNKADLIIDAGNLEKRKPSTIYDTISRKILREGDITKSQIEKALSQTD
jgi:tRNA threonylcarbamoyl adenosine modification protein (Sua5/YciO/YrdC/YwlC family)